MRRIVPLELVGQDSLAVDIYDEKGSLIYKKGEAVTPGLLMKICNMSIFVKDSSADTEGSKSKGLLKYKSIIPDETAKTLVSISKNLLKPVSENTVTDESLCKEAAYIIIDEVENSLEKIECISQLKIIDEYLFSHTVNVSTISAAIGMVLGFDMEEVKELAIGALLHDIGKMLVPKDILNKPAKLDPEELTIMRSHTLLGYRYILDKIKMPDKIAKVALDHQENYDGSGYPNGLKGKEINLYAQVTAIADVYDALTSNRVYKRAVDSDTAIETMLAEREARFNPYIFARFMHLVDYKNKNNLNLENKDII